MKRALLITIVLLALLPDVVKAQWTFDVVSVEAYINDHKKQRSLLLARSTLEYSNQLLHEYSRKEVGEYKELNIDLDRYTRAFDVIDVMYQSLRTVLNAKNTYNTVSDRIADYRMLTAAKASLPIPFPTKMPSVITNSAEKIIPSTVGSNSLRNNVLMSVFLKSILSLIFSIFILFIS